MLSCISGGNVFPNPLTLEEEKKYIKQYEDGSIEAKNILIERNLRLVAHIVKKYKNYQKDSEDLISIGTIGLIKAITTFKTDKGIKLATYAARCIENEILMYIRANKKHNKDIYLQDTVGIDKDGNEVTLEDKIADDSMSIDEQVNLNIQSKILYQKIKEILKGREKTIIELRYGLINGEELTQRDIAKRLGISRSYVSRIEKRALEKLHKEME
ncbi:RNA polymerase sporulation sigma factor SigK [uncultured Tyzzerella sp.]|uniref:RNA polymerase sporulation sigma factor SigK n=1 Tax=uncultured Tyzzerella sp. TaxID=2321398 RepID=UPI002942D80F|nr:RNA polymerase sporulation sigma factor SigK [uncultured Tyzzerella sp.]